MLTILSCWTSLIAAVSYINPSSEIRPPTQTSSMVPQDTMLQVELYTYTLPWCMDSLNGSMGVTVTGGTAPYQLLWSTGDTTTYIDQLAEGVYYLTVTDALGDSLVWSHTIWMVEHVEIFAIVVIPESCPGTCDATVVVEAYGKDPPFVYTITGNGCAGQQLVTVTDNNGCTDSEWVYIWSEEGPEIFNLLTTPTSPGMMDGQIEVFAFGEDPLSYSINGATFQASPVFSALAAGSYCVWVKDINGCTSKSDTVNIEEITGITDPHPYSFIFPNPATDRIHVSTSIPAALVLMDVQGRRIRTSKTMATHDVFLGDLPRGPYWLQFHTAGSVENRLVILQ